MTRSARTKNRIMSQEESTFSRLIPRAGLIACGAFVMLLLPQQVLRAEESEFQKEFDRLWSEARHFDEAGQWSKAAAAYAQIRLLAPHEGTSLSYLARCLALLGRDDEALECLVDAVEHGWNQAKVLKTADAFKRLRDRGAFDKLYVRIDEIERDETPIYIPSNLDRNQPAPLIIAFHGRVENPHYHLPTWKATADELRAIVVAPRGVHRAGDNQFNLWESPEARAKRDTSDIDLERCKRITAQAIEYAKSKATVDANRIVLTGYSQGGAVALALLADDAAFYAGAFAQATLYKAVGIDAWRAAHAKRAGRICILSGALDKVLPHGERVRDEAKAAGWFVRYETIPGVGHEEPKDNTQRRIEAMRFILSGVPTVTNEKERENDE